MNDSIWFWLYSFTLVSSTVFLVFQPLWNLIYVFFKKPLKSWSSAQKIPDTWTSAFSPTTWAVSAIEETSADVPGASDTKSGNLVSLLMTIIGIVMIVIFFICVLVLLPISLEAGLENSIVETVKLESGKLLYPHDPKWNVYCVSICIVCSLLVSAIRVVSNIEKASAKQILAETRELFGLLFGLLGHDILVFNFLSPDSYYPDFYNYLWVCQFSAVYDLALLGWDSNVPSFLE
tara:strand:+ start:394 stop:1095 length:702 start_codon:yes stop_codon:yes gene_type:complete